MAAHIDGSRSGRQPTIIWASWVNDFTVELHAVETRIDPPPGTPHITDVVLRARRR